MHLVTGFLGWLPNILLWWPGNRRSHGDGQGQATIGLRPSDYRRPQVGYVSQPPPVTDKIYNKQELAQMLDSPALQEWIRALASFNVLGSQVIIGERTL